MDENEISCLIRGEIFATYNALESAYEAVLTQILIEDGLNVKRQVPFPIIFNGVKLKVGYHVDLLINNLVIIEIKSIESLDTVHHKQVLTYLKLPGIKLGLLVNFNTINIADSIHRKLNGL